MNAKKAKQLRKIARQASNGQNVPHEAYIETEKNRKYVSVEKVSGDGKGTYTDQVQIAPGTVRLSPKSVKGLYKMLKKQFGQQARA